MCVPALLQGSKWVYCWEPWIFYLVQHFLPLPSVLFCPQYSNLRVSLDRPEHIPQRTSHSAERSWSSNSWTGQPGIASIVQLPVTSASVITKGRALFSLCFCVYLYIARAQFFPRERKRRTVVYWYYWVHSVTILTKWGHCSVHSLGLQNRTFSLGNWLAQQFSNGANLKLRTHENAPTIAEGIRAAKTY